MLCARSSYRYYKPSDLLLGLEGFESRFLHGGARGRFAGKDLELPYGLLDEHLDPRNDYLILLSRPANQRGFERIVDQVEHHVGRNFAIEEAAVDVRKHTERSRVHNGIEAAFGHQLPYQGLGAAAFSQRPDT